ncbi:hypothetical protein D6P12_14235 [Salmonella enterica subsp. enterica serovar Enteritidis]|nr:hypothetical protein D6P12_14235 [Salmonella enterica subsp. enterica serovar Enteritidis]EAQ9872604.1 hypothetical protein [Salmonella enterica]
MLGYLRPQSRNGLIYIFLAFRRFFYSALGNHHLHASLLKPRPRASHPYKYSAIQAIGARLMKMHNDPHSMDSQSIFALIASLTFFDCESLQIAAGPDTTTVPGGVMC